MSKTYRNHVLLKEYSFEEVAKRYGHLFSKYPEEFEDFKQAYVKAKQGYYAWSIFNYAPEGAKKYYRKRFNKRFRQECKQYLRDIENERFFPVEKDSLGQMYWDM